MSACPSAEENEKYKENVWQPNNPQTALDRGLFEGYLDCFFAELIMAFAIGFDLVHSLIGFLH